MTRSETVEEITLWRVVRDWWWVMLLAAVVAGLIGYAVATRLPKSYQSTATMLVGPINTDLALDASGSLTATYQSLATSQPVLQSAISATRAHMTTTQLLGAVSTTSNTVSRLVTVSVSDANPRLAARLANVIVNRVRSLANTTPQTTNAEIAAFDQTPAIQSLTPAQQADVESALRQVIGVAPAGEVSIVNRATPPSAAASPRKPLIAVLAALAGLAIAALALLLRAGSKRVTTDERSLAELDQTYLGVVDVAWARDLREAVPVEARPESSAATAYRMLAARLSLAESRSRSLLVVDSTDGSAAAVVAANLASALSRMTDRSVLLADVSPELRGATRIFGLEGREGSAELIAAPDLEALNGELSELLVERGDGVQVLARGTGESIRTPSAERARELLRRLRRTADLVVLAGPPMTRSPSALSWARAADSALFVVDGSKAPHDEVLQAISDLRLANGRFVGTVMGRRRMAFPRPGSGFSVLTRHAATGIGG